MDVTIIEKLTAILVSLQEYLRVIIEALTDLSFKV